MEKLRQLVLEEKYTELELAAHTLKGAAATIGATEVADAADRLQRNAVNYERGNHQNDLRDQLAELDKLMDTLWVPSIYYSAGGFLIQKITLPSWRLLF